MADKIYSRYYTTVPVVKYTEWLLYRRNWLGLSTNVHKYMNSNAYHNCISSKSALTEEMECMLRTET